MYNHIYIYQKKEGPPMFQICMPRRGRGSPLFQNPMPRRGRGSPLFRKIHVSGAEGGGGPPCYDFASEEPPAGALS